MSGSTKLPCVYWDACVFISHLAGQATDSLSLSGMIEWAQRVDLGTGLIITSSITVIEVLEAKLSETAKTDFKSLFSSPYIHQIACGEKVIGVATELRNYYASRVAVGKNKVKTISTPDAIQLASAILYEASEFHTFDGCGDPKNHKKKTTLPLIPLSGKVGRYPLKVCTPNAEQLHIV
jgi:predicted nucleic acid-binding protein